MDETILGSLPVHVEIFPDLDIKVPEKQKEIEAQRQAIVSCILALRKPDGYDDFEEAVIEMFESFGMTESLDSQDKEENRLRWKKTYDDCHKLNVTRGAAIIGEIEIRGVKRSYANIHFEQKKLLRHVPFIIVAPGACSIADARIPPLKTNSYFAERSFYTNLRLVAQAF